MLAVGVDNQDALTLPRKADAEVGANGFSSFFGASFLSLMKHGVFQSEKVALFLFLKRVKRITTRPRNPMIIRFFGLVVIIP